MCQRDPFFAPIRETRALSDEMKSFSLPVGSDGHIRAGNIPFKQKTMRSSPMGGSIFAMDSRFRMLIEMPEAWTGIYSDLSSCEFVVAAMKSGDKNMIAMCNNVRAGLSQSPYIEIMKAAGLLGAEIKSKSDAGPDYKNWKNGSLATIYGQEAEGLCNNLNVPMHIAHRIHGFVHSHFPQFWKYVEYERITSEARGYAETRGGWRLDVRHQKFRTLKNFPVQAEAAEIMHLGASKMSDGGVMICTTVHDAVLAMCPTERAQETAAFIAQCWREAGQEVIGYPISTDQYIFTGRFTESGSMPAWERLLAGLEKAESKTMALEEYA
jgi:DNA polymerase I-like protein with 3'-5' exonuclease and polymerase domains